MNTIRVIQEIFTFRANLGVGAKLSDARFRFTGTVGDSSISSWRYLFQQKRLYFINILAFMCFHTMVSLFECRTWIV